MLPLSISEFQFSRILAGTKPTATATTMPLAAGSVEYFGVPAGGTMKIAVIAAA